ncbi:MAG: nucleoside triphosphate pyrophosphohydrolase [Bacteroidia bacterium]|nr:nucleoside triphosphate pyrophosphohydrolase [Bacteroidia bacterium]NNM15567.1 nucleoside triphosphate pyrophosphohydrolase [Bacteroidia bacterium]
MNFRMKEKLKAFERLLNIMDELREKCPWDNKQTMETLRHLSIEEVYELADAILENKMDEVKGELGDLILHIVFYAKIADENKDFDISDVLNGICEKLIQRHPHIYGDVKVENEEEVKQNWEDLKMKEGRTSALQGVPTSLPALIKAMRIQEKARGTGFDWEETKQVFEKVEEELEELKEAINNKDSKKTQEEFGDLLFALVNYSRFIDVNPEEALEKTNKKFIRRFQYLEQEAKQAGKTLREMKLEEMDVYWNEAKAKGL